jgi:formate dehydrogenase maturation protein FdhE
MTDKPDLILNEEFQKCLVNIASDIDALPTQRELLYTLTSASSLIYILRTLFIYIDADIQRLKTTVTLNSQECLQRYVRETLCPICVSTPSLYFSSINNDNNVNEPLCENDCHYVIKNCFNETSNPYVAFSLIAQGYSSIIKQIQQSVDELKVKHNLHKKKHENSLF